VAGAGGFISGVVAGALCAAEAAITSILLIFAEETAAAVDRLLDRLARDVRRRESVERGFLLGDSAHAVEVGLKAAVAGDRAAAPAECTWSGILDYFLSLRPARLVVTGQPGAGKTTLTAELALAWLVVRDERTSTDCRRAGRGVSLCVWLCRVGATECRLTTGWSTR
jgi:hypothetical protein